MGVVFDVLVDQEIFAGRIWHGVDAKYIAGRAPILAGVLGVSTARGIAAIADEIEKALRSDS